MRKEASLAYGSRNRPEEVILSGKRLDGRGYEALRPIFLSAGGITQAAGSAYAEMGQTKVMVAVQAPRESDRRETYTGRGRLQVELRRTSFCTSTRLKSRPEADRDNAEVLQTALEAAVQLEAFPKNVVDVHCLIMESGGSEVAVLITAASMALASAGIPMFDLVSACSISKVGGSLLLDPTLDETYREEGACLIAMMASQSKVTQLIVNGEWTSGQLKLMMELGMGGCAILDETVRVAVRDVS